MGRWIGPAVLGSQRPPRDEFAASTDASQPGPRRGDSVVVWLVRQLGLLLGTVALASLLLPLVAGLIVNPPVLVVLEPLTLVWYVFFLVFLAPGALAYLLILARPGKARPVLESRAARVILAFVVVGVPTFLIPAVLAYMSRLPPSDAPTAYLWAGLNAFVVSVSWGALVKLRPPAVPDRAGPTA
jgi:hypothetical protein